MIAEFMQLISSKIPAFLQAFFSIFVIMDVLGNVPIFWMLSNKLNSKQRKISINKAIMVASLVLLSFLFLGEHILNFFGITIHSFKVAGGIIILIVGLEMVLGLHHHKEKKYEKYEFAIVPLATPLITGPGVITTIILLTQSVGLWITLIASLVNLGLSWVFLTYSDFIFKFLGRQGAEIMSRLMGLILAAIAIGFITSGWMAIIG